VIEAEKPDREEPFDVSDGLKRLLEIGEILASVLTPEETESLRILLSQIQSGEASYSFLQNNLKIGNTGVT
jgi:hypothetical protein